MSRVNKVKQLLDFWTQFLEYSEEEREECVQFALESARKFKNGKVSKDGNELYKYLTSGEWSITGLAPNLFYFRVNSEADNEEDKQADLDALWVHPFSLFTLVLTHKSLPLIVLCNSNLMYNDTVLAHIDGNKGLKVIMNLIGHTG